MSDKKKTGDERYAWHACWHDDAWRGIELMPPEIVGVYWRIILMMYRRQSALPDDDATLAMACFTSLKAYRRAKAALIEAGRVEVDAQNGLIYCKRAVKQLVKDQRYRETQSDNGKKGGRPVLAVDNVATFPNRHDDPLGADLEGDLGGGFSVDNSASIRENQGNRKSQTKATHTHTQRESLPDKAEPPRRSPHKSGGASAVRREPANIVKPQARALEEQRELLRQFVDAERVEPAAPKAEPQKPKAETKAADRRATRRA